MKKIGTILKFELGNYFGSKSYLISTILLALLCVGIMFAPRIKESLQVEALRLIKRQMQRMNRIRRMNPYMHIMMHPVLWMKVCWRRYIRMLSCRNVRMQQK